MTIGEGGGEEEIGESRQDKGRRCVSPSTLNLSVHQSGLHTLTSEISCCHFGSRSSDVCFLFTAKSGHSRECFKCISKDSTHSWMVMMMHEHKKQKQHWTKCLISRRDLKQEHPGV